MTTYLVKGEYQDETEVPDPFHGGPENFERVRILRSCCSTKCAVLRLMIVQWVSVVMHWHCHAKSVAEKCCTCNPVTCRGTSIIGASTCFIDRGCNDCTACVCFAAAVLTKRALDVTCRSWICWRTRVKDCCHIFSQRSLPQSLDCSAVFVGQQRRHTMLVTAP